MFVKPIISSSKGVCIAVWGKDKESRLLLDCGFTSKVKFYDAMEELKWDRPAALFISHRHTDHFSKSAATCMDECCTTVYAPEPAPPRYPESKTEIYYEPGLTFRFGDLAVTFVETKHDPKFKTMAIVIEDDAGAMASFIIEGKPSFMAPFTGSGLIYIESNHDEYLLTRLPNLKSYYHLSNFGAAECLTTLIENTVGPKTIILGGVSEARNTPLLASREVHVALERQRLCDMDKLSLWAAHRYSKSRTTEVKPDVDISLEE